MNTHRNTYRKYRDDGSSNTNTEPQGQGILDRLETTARRKGTVLCLGLDPVPERIPAGPTGADETERTRNFLLRLLERLGPLVSAVKPNSAFYEQLGPGGIELLVEISAMAREMGLVVILDAKRGDIGGTSKAYARYVFDVVGADMVTLSPWLGDDSLEPFFERMIDGGRGCYLLNRTSNPGGALFQNLVSDGRPLYEHTAEAICRWNAEHSPAVGAVIGATAIEEFRRITTVYARNGRRPPLLVPGVGSQGGDAASVVSILRERGMLARSRVNSSSSILYAHEKHPGMDWLDASEEETRRLAGILPPD